ncbi:DUF3142 domain-containing protein [Novosphingobium cyanobacteriorum]|uniref:DUF3142 domain-containing protein n=1 Tax=Novosphingobium cyanobacteriorum TaxID=3024215 RepID=A0ABT6CMC8_9SPHN|nr:DUF3142 domain-containing protein [Novosphingobium cyanobacteriorum]MDF8335022.1 DUF3142 domain-containing protein [Novosphingobium cyanobacteriorum]
MVQPAEGAVPEEPLGEEAALLLVKRAGLALAVALSACAPAQEMPVDPAQHDAFYLWAGVPPPDYLAKASTLYILGGEVRRGGPPRYVSLRGIPRLHRGEVWLVVRSNRLDWDARTTDAVMADLVRWRAAGNPLAGLQVDFDTATGKLDGYAEFLRGLRAQLPQGMRLSVTGLMDWSANGDPAALASLQGVVDEVVIQTYQGTRTIAGYEAYFRRIDRVPVPHRVALVQGGRWREPPELSRDPRFTGYVVFLLTPPRGSVRDPGLQ